MMIDVKGFEGKIEIIMNIESKKRVDIERI